MSEIKCSAHEYFERSAQKCVEKSAQKHFKRAAHKIFERSAQKCDERSAQKHFERSAHKHVGGRLINMFGEDGS